MINQIELQNQYKGTNIEALLQGIAKIKEKYVSLAIDSAKDCMDLTKASGDALDMWGRLLNFSRYVPISQENKDLFNNFTFYNRNFVKLKFADHSDIAYVGLTDSAYRLVLQLLWSSRNIPSTIFTTSSLASEIFQAEVIVGDSMDMSYITYYFRDEIPLWFNYILTNYDILPRPACVGSKFVSAIFRIFGFQNDDKEFGLKHLASFWNTRFADDVERPSDYVDSLKDSLKDKLEYIGAKNLEELDKL